MKKSQQIGPGSLPRAALPFTDQYIATAGEPCRDVLQMASNLSIEIYGSRGLGLVRVENRKTNCNKVGLVCQPVQRRDNRENIAVELNEERLKALVEFMTVVTANDLTARGLIDKVTSNK
jgi:hypothetical protein